MAKRAVEVYVLCNQDLAVDKATSGRRLHPLETMNARPSWPRTRSVFSVVLRVVAIVGAGELLDHRRAAFRFGPLLSGYILVLFLVTSFALIIGALSRLL